MTDVLICLIVGFAAGTIAAMFATYGRWNRK